MIQTEAAQTVVADLTKDAPAPTVPAPSPMPVSTPTPPPGPTSNPNIPMAVIPIPVTGGPAAVAKYNTTIYSGPGTNYVVYAAFLGGATAKVVGKSQDGLWWAISVPVSPTGSGWVDGKWVTVSNASNVPVVPMPPVPPTVDLVPPGSSDPQAVALANVYIRTGPATNYPAYGIAPAGTTGRVIGKSEDGQWWVVRLNPEKVGAGYGWVMAQYTQASNVASVQTIQNPVTYARILPTTPPAGAPMAMAVDYVNVRTGPGTNYVVLGVASPGAFAEISGKTADSAWWQVKIDSRYSSNGFGWVSAGYVITQNTASVPVVKSPPQPPVVQVAPTPPSATGCSLVSQSPEDGTLFAPGVGFTTTWVLKNTGSAKWDEAEVDVRYVGAVANIPLHQGADVYNLATSVQPGDTYNFTVSMIAPFDPGSYGEQWELSLGSLPGQQTCQFFLYIEVK